MRVNRLIESKIDFSKFKFNSFLDLGCGNGLVAAEWRGLDYVPKKVAYESALPSYNICLDGRKPFEALNDSWEKIQDVWDEKNLTRGQDTKYWNTKFDLITLMDSIQYSEKPKSEEILDHALEMGKFVLVWTVEGYYPFQEALCCWHPDEFVKRGMNVIVVSGFHAGPPYPVNAIIAYKYEGMESKPIEYFNYV